MAERRKSPKKWRKTGKGQNNLRKTGKGNSVGNRKQPFSSHGKPVNLKIFVETGKLFLKVEENDKLGCRKPEKPKKTMRSRVNRKIRKQATERRKIRYIPAESRKATPSYRPS